MVANALAGLDAPGHADPVLHGQPWLHTLDEALETLRRRLARHRPTGLEIVPLRGPVGADYLGWAAVLAEPSGRPPWPVPESIAADSDALTERSTLAWLAGGDLLLPETQASGPLDAAALRCLQHSVRWFLPVHGSSPLAGLPAAIRWSEAVLPALTYSQRLALLVDGLGATGERLRDAAAECARRFRLEAPAIRRIAADLHGMPGLDAVQLAAACHGAAEDRHDDTTQRVTPRFTVDDLVLPPAQLRQIHEIRTAMRMLTAVHYRWGTARVWNEGGLAVLFCGPSGTGKTMAAEALASDLALDLYRIDLSQVVNKYIGETEKNLRRVFDAAEASDCILFFDEADALFGKRTEVKDAHDRFANIEISYLLERMEQFKGLAILATNRRKDLDEAFLRRLRYVVEFPVPGAAERERIWRAGIPAQVDAAELEFRFLARQFAFTGGHIRSVIFNACLQAAGTPPQAPLPAGKVGRLTMRDVLVQVKRELDKLNRAAGDEQFGAYARDIAEWAA
jgi:vesicle-fusing ATPase